MSNNMLKVGIDLRKNVFETFAKEGITIFEMKKVDATLEDAFMKLITNDQETIEEATRLDDLLVSSWTGHPHLRIIDNSSNFEDKMKRLMREIAAVLGEPNPYEIERKFLIEMPDISYLESLPNCEKVKIVQTYLVSNEDEEVRVRQRGYNGSYIYTQTIKKNISDIKRIEIEKRLSKDEYLNLLMMNLV